MNESKTTLNTQDIKCMGCAGAARKAVEKLPGIKQIEFDVPGKTVTVIHDQQVTREELARALTVAGFPSV